MVADYFSAFKLAVNKGEMKRVAEENTSIEGSSLRG